MRKIFTLAIALMCFAASNAQKFEYIGHPQWEVEICIEMEIDTLWKMGALAGRSGPTRKSSNDSTEYVSYTVKYTDGVTVYMQYRFLDDECISGYIRTMYTDGQRRDAELADARHRLVEAGCSLKPDGSFYYMIGGRHVKHNIGSNEDTHGYRINERFTEY